MSYATVTLNAANLSADKKTGPVEAWERCAKNEFPNSESSAKKSCPKNAFLGLCDAGKIKGISVGVYSSSELNKSYALTAVDILTSGSNKTFAPVELWNEVLKKLKADINKRHNSQMNVVLALWENGLIIN